jgi:hypothetical protein
MITSWILDKFGHIILAPPCSSTEPDSTTTSDVEAPEQRNDGEGNTSAINNGNGGGATATNTRYILRLPNPNHNEWVRLRQRYGVDADTW